MRSGRAPACSVSVGGTRSVDVYPSKLEQHVVHGDVDLKAADLVAHESSDRG
jgi:hypothetical protein